MKTKQIIRSIGITSLFILIIFISGCTSPNPSEETVLTISTSTEDLTYSLAQLKAKSTVTGYGGFLKSAANVEPLPIEGPHQYTGVPLATLMDELNELPSDYSLVVGAEDGYEMTFSKEEAEGQLETFYLENSTSKGIHEVEPVIAYESSRDEFEALRLVFIDSDAQSTDEGVVTEGHFWVKHVTSLEVRSVVANWKISLKGAVNRNLTRDELESGFYCPQHDHGFTWNESNDIYAGVPLYMIIAMIDDVDTLNDHYAFNISKAETNYTITLRAKSGESVNITSLELYDAYKLTAKKYTGYLLAYKKNNEYFMSNMAPLYLTGSEVEASQSIAQITEIQLTFT